MSLRVHELAREAGVSASEALQRLRDQGEYAKSASSTVSVLAARRLLESFGVQTAVHSNVPQTSRVSDGTNTPATTYTWQANPVKAPRNEDVIRNTQILEREFPVAAIHREMLQSLGSQIVYSKIIKSADNKKLGMALVRFSGAVEAAFGLTREVMFFYAPYYDLQIRTYTKALELLRSHSDRASPDLIFFCAPDERVTIKIEDWSDLKTVVIPVPADLDREPIELIRLLRDHVYARDLFYETTPVRGDRFFGRRTLLQELRDDVLSQRVSGVFGLRKSGKTSVLQQLGELMGSEELLMVFVDLEVLPSPPEDPTEAFVTTLAARVATQLGKHRLSNVELTKVQEDPTPQNLQDAMERTLRRLGKKHIRLAVLLDEIEFLTPTDRLDVAEGEFSGVAQVLGVLRSLVQGFDGFTFLLSGLTNEILENGRLYGRPNPLFSWAKARYIGPFSRAEADELATAVGAKMGIEIEGGALQSLYEASGGHAYLYRNLASEVVASLPVATYRRVIRKSDVLRQLIPWKRSVAGNLEEIFGHLERYYPTESVLIDILIDAPNDFAEIAPSEDQAVHHLVSLGLLREAAGGYEPSTILELR